MTLDARALIAIVRKEPGFERLVEAIADDPTPRVAAPALAEAGMILAAQGVGMPEAVLEIVMWRLNLTVVPFTKEHWKGAVRAYEKGRKAGERPVFGQCLSTAVASVMGAPIVE